MNTTNLVIKGAVYFDRESDQILIPHYTGEFSIVDCDRYMKAKELKENYNKKYIAEVRDNYLIYEGEKYFYAEYSPFYVNDTWELLSDLSELSYFEEKTEF